MKTQQLTSDQYGLQVAQIIYDALPNTIKICSGLTVESVLEDIQGQLSADMETLEKKYPELPTTVDDCWESDISYQEAAAILTEPYIQIVSN